MRFFILILIRIYQKVFSPDQGLLSCLSAGHCRFYPSCSQYCYEAVVKFGIVKGFWLAGKRVLRCHPFHGCGYDPLP